MDLGQGVLFGLGNLLLDIVATVPDSFLAKYKLQPDSTQQFDEELHFQLFDDIQNHGSSIVENPGGCALNTIRVAQWILKFPKATTFVGAVGVDDESKKLLSLLDNEGIGLACQQVSNIPTGRCAVLITGSQRTLVTQLGAALRFNYKEFMEPKNFSVIDAARVFYISGYFLRVSHTTAMSVVRFAASKDCPVVLNLNAIWVLSLCKAELQEIMPYVDYLIGNNNEAIVFAKENDCPYVEIHQISKWTAGLPKLKSARSRIVIITRSEDPLIVATCDSFKEIPVISVPKNKFVDTNGAGDAFAGGFIAGLVKGKSHDDCISYGLWAASEIIQHQGCNFTKEKSFPYES